MAITCEMLFTFLYGNFSNICALILELNCDYLRLMLLVSNLMFIDVGGINLRTEPRTNYFRDPSLEIQYIFHTVRIILKYYMMLP